MNRRKPSPHGKKALLLALVFIVLAAITGGVFFLLGRAKIQEPPTAKVPLPSKVSRLPLPPREAAHQNYSSASGPAGREVVVEPKHQKGPGTVAIIIDDMGSSMQELDSLLSINLPVTFSVIPSNAHAKGVAEAAHRAGAEVMVHMPMEPEGYPKQPMEKIGLLLSMPNGEVADRVNGYFKSVPYAVGANNHMGSRFTQNAEKMDVVLRVLRDRDVFFVDSRTSPSSVGYRRAMSLGMRCAARQVFLDNVQDEAAIAKQLEQVAAVARKRGSAIAIGHPHPPTIRALKARMPELARNGITFVPVSALVR